MEKDQTAESLALARALKTFATMLRRMKRKAEAIALEAQAKAILQGKPITASSKKIAR